MAEDTNHAIPLVNLQHLDFANLLNEHFGFPSIGEDDANINITGSWIVVAGKIRLQYPSSDAANLYIVSILSEIIAQTLKDNIPPILPIDTDNDRKLEVGGWFAATNAGIEIYDINIAMAIFTPEVLEDMAELFISGLRENLNNPHAPRAVLAAMREKIEQLEKAKKNREQVRLTVAAAMEKAKKQREAEIEQRRIMEAEHNPKEAKAAVEKAKLEAEERYRAAISGMPKFIATLQQLHLDTMLAISSTRNQDAINAGLMAIEFPPDSNIFALAFKSGLAQLLLAIMLDRGVHLSPRDSSYPNRYSYQTFDPDSLRRVTPRVIIESFTTVCEQYKRHMQASDKDIDNFKANHPELCVKLIKDPNGVDYVVRMFPGECFDPRVLSDLLGENDYHPIVLYSSEDPLKLFSARCKKDLRAKKFLQRFYTWEQTWEGRSHVQKHLLATILEEIKTKCIQKSWQMWGSGSEIKTDLGTYGIPRHYAKIFQDIQTCLAAMAVNEQHLEPEQMFNHYKDTIDRTLGRLEESIKTKDDWMHLFRSVDTTNFDRYLLALIRRRLAFLDKLLPENDQKRQEPSFHESIEGKEVKISLVPHLDN